MRTAKKQFPPSDLVGENSAEIALAYGWHDVVAHYLDTRGVGYLADLSLPQLEDLASRLEGYLDALEHGHSPPDHPPAY